MQNQTRLLFLLLFLLSGSLFLFGEGTKQILLNDAGHGKIQVRPGTNDFAWYDASGSADEEYRLYIHVANIGEVIYYGFGDPLNSADQVVNSVNYRIKDPYGTIVVGPGTVPLSGTGHINTFNQAVAGPSAIAGATGYTALSYSPTVTGDFFIEFNFSTATHDRIKFKYFDITVAGPANTAINGRVWSKAWQMTADDYVYGGGYTFWGKLFPYSDDGVVTSINFNGMEPFVFVVSCNPWGCYNSGDLTSDRQSVYGTHTLTQYKIFLNDPDPLEYPTGILGNVVTPVDITSNCDGTAVINLDVTKSGNADILLDINPLSGKQPEDVEISTPLNAGINPISWDGFNGLGQPVPGGTIFNILITYINGLTNLPIFDVEANQAGFVIELHRPSGPVPEVFWDDIQVGGTQNFSGCTSIPPATGCHTWDYSTGDGNTINTWWHAVDTVQAPVVYTQHRLPGMPGTITGAGSLCPGTNGLVYWIHKEQNSASYNWGYSGTGATITQINDTTISINYSANASSGNITVNGINSLCGAGPARTKAITVYATPAVTLSPFSTVCLSTPPFPLSGGSPSGGIYSIGGVPVPVFDPAIYGTGTYTVTYTYTDPATSCTSAVTGNLTVNPPPVITFPALTPVCVTLAPFPLSGATPAGGTYKGPGVSAGVFSPSVAGTGTHTIKYIFTDPVGCSDSAIQTLTVEPLPAVPGPVSGTLSFCQGAAGLNYGIAPVSHATTYVWSVTPPGAGTITGTGTTAMVNWSSGFTGTAMISVFGVNFCGEGPVSPGLTVTANPKPVVSFTLCNDSITTTGAKPFYLKGGSPPGGSYSGEGVTTGTGILNPYTAGVGTHPISYHLTNSYGCSSSATKNIIVINPAMFSCGNKIKDVRDNRQYGTVEINSQCWMAENLNYGKQIQGGTSQRDNCSIEKYCYNDIASNCTGSGALYQWDELMQYGATTAMQGICMPGWHVPSEAEWNILFSNYTNSGFAASALKSTGFSGFNALLKGADFKNMLMDFNNFATYFWSSDSGGPFKAWSHAMNSYNFSVSFYPAARSNGFSVRCLKD